MTDTFGRDINIGDVVAWKRNSYGFNEGVVIDTTKYSFHRWDGKEDVVVVHPISYGEVTKRTSKVKCTNVVRVGTAKELGYEE